MITTSPGALSSSQATSSPWNPSLRTLAAAPIVLYIAGLVPRGAFLTG